MKTKMKAQVTVVLVLTVCWAARSVSAQSFGVDFRNTLMPASGGMAGTSIAAPQDFLSGINANPATLTQYHGTQFTLGGAFAGSTFDLNQTGAAPAIGVTPFSAKSGTPGAGVPNIGVTQELSAYGLPVTLGLGVIGAAGAGTSFLKQPQSNGTSNYLLLLEFAASAGVKLTDRLSVGSTLFLGDGFLDGPFVGTGAMTNAYALRGSLGTSYQLTENTSLGFYYQTRQRFRFKDEVILFNSAVSRDVHLALPDQIGLGIANSSLLDRKLLLAADILYLQWNRADMFQDIYRNQWVLQLGTQYRVNNRVRLRLGYAWAEDPVDPNVGTSVAGIPVPGGVPAVKYLQAQFAVVNQHRLSAGIGINDVLPGLDFDAFAGGMFEASQSFGTLTSISMESYWIGLGFTWRFNRGDCNYGAWTSS
jgi:long-chain fatty acid transport protein